MFISVTFRILSFRTLPFIPYKKIRIAFSTNYPFTTFHIPRSTTYPFPPKERKLSIQSRRWHLQVVQYASCLVRELTSPRDVHFDILVGSCTDPLLPMRVKFSVLEQTKGLHLPAKFHQNVFIVSACGGQKQQFLEILTFLAAAVLTPFYRWGPNLVCYSRPTAYAYVSNFVSICLFCRPLAAKSPNFAIFSTLAFSGIASWQQSEKVEHGCTTTNLPLSNGIKIVSVLQCLHGEIGHKNSDVQKSDEQTDKKTQRFCHPGGGWNPSPTKLGMVIENLELVLAPWKLLKVWCIVLPLGALKIWG